MRQSTLGCVRELPFPLPTVAGLESGVAAFPPLVPHSLRRPTMFGLRRNAMIGLNLYCGGASLGAAGGSPAGTRLAAEEAKARREGGGEAALLPGARVVARPPPVGAEDPDVTASPERRLLRSPDLLAVQPEEKAASAAAIMSPEEELDGYEPEVLSKRPAVLSLLERVSEAARHSGADGSLPSTPPPAEEEDDELYRQSLEIISRYLREQATGSKDTKPLGEAGAAGRRALETLRRVGDGVQRNHETAFQGKRRPRQGGPGRAGKAGDWLCHPNVLAVSHCFRPSGSSVQWPERVGCPSRRGVRLSALEPGEPKSPRRGWAGGRAPPRTKEAMRLSAFLLLRHASETGH